MRYICIILLTILTGCSAQTQQQETTEMKVEENSQNNNTFQPGIASMTSAKLRCSVAAINYLAKAIELNSSGLNKEETSQKIIDSIDTNNKTEKGLKFIKWSINAAVDYAYIESNDNKISFQDYCIERYMTYGP